MNLIKSMFSNLIAQAAENPELAAKYSVLDHHAKGFDYLNLHFSKEFSVKLYMNRPDDLVTCGTENYLVNPHDHGYNFHSFVLRGEVRNINFNVGYGSPFHQFKFDWRTKAMVPAGEVRLSGTSTRYTEEAYRSSYYLTHDQIHTIALPKDQEVLLMLVQFMDVPKGPTSLFLPSATLPSMEGLYRKPTVEETARLIGKAMRLAGAGTL